MDSHLLLADAHRKCLQLLSTHRHYEGLQQASRKSVGMPSKLKRHLTHLDIAFAWSRHITIARVNSLVADLNAYLGDDVHDDVELASESSMVDAAAGEVGNVAELVEMMAVSDAELGIAPELYFSLAFPSYHVQICTSSLQFSALSHSH